MPLPTLAVLDDGLFVRTYAREVRPLAATFHRFVEAVAGTGHFARVRYIIPVRHLRIWEVEPALDPVDEARVEIVPTTFFSGITDYLLRSGYVAARNWRPIEQAIAGSDLLWLRLPASNALLALAAARIHRVPHFGWVAGSAGQVARAQPRPPGMRRLAGAAGAAYDAVTELAGRGGPLVRLDSAMFASVVTAREIEQTMAADRSVAQMGPLRLVWAGRMAGEKGLAELLGALRLLLDGGRDVSLTLIGDGPAYAQVERAAATLPEGRVRLAGYVGDRPTYLELLRKGHLFVHTSRAEGVPKVLVEAMAAGLPVVAADVGAIADVLGHGERGRLVPAGDPAATAAAVAELIDDPDQRRLLRQRGLAWAVEHTAEAQARGLVGWLMGHFPHLNWKARA